MKFRMSSRGQLVRESHLQLEVPVAVLSLISVGSPEESFRIIRRPFGKPVRRVDASAFLPESSLAVNVLDVRDCRDGLPELVEVVPDHLRGLQDCSSSVPTMIPSHRGIGLRSVLFQLAVCMIVQKH